VVGCGFAIEHSLVTKTANLGFAGFDCARHKLHFDTHCAYWAATTSAVVMIAAWQAISCVHAMIHGDMVNRHASIESDYCGVIQYLHGMV
jgi:hypothetical protein